VRINSDTFNSTRLCVRTLFQALIQTSQGIGQNFLSVFTVFCRSQRPRSLRRRSSAARLLRSWVRIPPGAWIFVCCECCVLSSRGLCDGLIIRSEESYRLWCVVVCYLETTKILLNAEEAKAPRGLSRQEKNFTVFYLSNLEFETSCHEWELRKLT